MSCLLDWQWRLYILSWTGSLNGVHQDIRNALLESMCGGTDCEEGTALGMTWS